MEDNYPVLYVFVNTDLPSMNPGKAQAHSGHAANAFINKTVVQPLRSGNKPISQCVNEWMAATPFGFGTQINLKGKWNEVINTVADWCEAGGVGELVIDPTYPYIVDSEIVKLISPNVHSQIPFDLENGKFLCHRNEVTAAYVFGRKDILEPYVGKYTLHP
jgi:hypothetical protein